MIFPTEYFSSGFKQVRRSIEGSFEKGHRSLHLEQEVAARSEGTLYFRLFVHSANNKHNV